MSHTAQLADRHAPSDTPRRHGIRVVSVAAGALTLAATVVLLGVDALVATEPAEMLTSLEANLAPLRVVAYLACFGAVGLFVATASLADALPGWRRQLATSAGTAVAVLSAAYLVTTTAAADVVTGGLSDPGPGVVEATLVSLQTLGITRYAATVALASLGVLAGDRLPRWMRIAAGVLAVAAMGTPVAWVAALLAPVWLGLAGALCRRRP